MLEFGFDILTGVTGSTSRVMVLPPESLQRSASPRLPLSHLVEEKAKFVLSIVTLKQISLPGNNFTELGFGLLQATEH